MTRFKKLGPKELKERLDPLQFSVTQESATEPPFKNPYWNEHRPGLYVDITSGEPLFSSLDKFDSDCGWPSFSRPIQNESIVQLEDHQLSFETRTEVRAKDSDSHLGHVFADGPKPTGLRYCINSAALRFVPLEKLREEGYGDSLNLFPNYRATLAGGCFWGVEEMLSKLPGVIATTVGYSGGQLENPSYEEVCEGDTGHAEAVEVLFDLNKTSYKELIRYFFRIHDPTTLNQQGPDTGSQYRSVIFYHSEKQKREAEEVRDEIAKSGLWKDSITTELMPAKSFYPAEEYHQDYLKKNPGGYSCHYLRG